MLWWRYIDDIFFIWTSDEESLTRFIDHINSFHRTIKFTSEYSTTETYFVDVVIRKEENGLTDLFVKPTDKSFITKVIKCVMRNLQYGSGFLNGHAYCCALVCQRQAYGLISTSSLLYAQGGSWHSQSGA